MSPYEDVEIRQAATVVLLRDTDDGLQTWLLRRVRQMAFAAGMSVFPGGAVDPGDAILAESLIADPATTRTLDAVAAQLGSTPLDAARLMSAAIRETFEEVGVLLSRPPEVIPSASRAAVERRELTLERLLADSALDLDLDAVRPWARWITPKGEARRYDTYFFVAVMPSGAAAEAVTSEASHADWIGVAQALEEFRQGSRPMLPPTISTLTEIAAHGTAEQVLHAAIDRDVRPVQPTFLRDDAGELWVDLGDGRRFELPAGFQGASGRTP